MKKLHFDNLAQQIQWIILLVLSIVLILLGLFKPFEFQNPKIYKYLSMFGFLTQVVFYSRLFWYKNNVQWNKKGIVIRIKPYFGKSILFEEIKAVELHENSMTIIRSSGSDLSIDLLEIRISDREKLFQLLNKYIE